MLRKALCDLFCFPFSLIFSSPICYPIFALALSTCNSPNLTCLSQNSVLYTWNSSLCFYSSFSIQFKDPGPSLVTPPYYWCPSDFCSQLPTKYSTWISQRLFIFYMLETENITSPKSAHFPLSLLQQMALLPSLLLIWNPKHHTGLLLLNFQHVLLFYPWISLKSIQ